MKNTIKSGIFGVCIGDALGVPVEFKERSYLKEHPVTGYLEYMSWNQPKGTWSDDSSLTLCLAEILVKGYNLEKLGESFVKWYKYGHWTAHGKLFDIGGTTKHAIARLYKRRKCGIFQVIFLKKITEMGLLMRILPLFLSRKKKKI